MQSGERTKGLTGPPERRQASEAPSSVLPNARSKPRGAIPLYYQVMRELKERITSGALRPGDRLPSELDMTTQYGVSRVVIRRALRILEQEQLIVRKKGCGTFVREKAPKMLRPLLRAIWKTSSTWVSALVRE